MAEISIKGLPQLDEIRSGDYLLVQTQNATNIIQFRDFIIDLENTTFSSSLSANAQDIEELDTKISTLSSSITTINNTLTSDINSLSDQIDLYTTQFSLSIGNLNNELTSFENSASKLNTDINTLSSALENTFFSNTVVADNITQSTHYIPIDINGTTYRILLS